MHKHLLSFFFTFFMLVGPSWAQSQCLETTTYRQDKFGNKVKLLSEVRGGFDNIVAVNEVKMGCVPAAITRGVWNLTANSWNSLSKKHEKQKKFDVDEFHKELLKEIGYIPVKKETQGGASSASEAVAGATESAQSGPGVPDEDETKWLAAKTRLVKKWGYSIDSKYLKGPGRGKDHTQFFKDMVTEMEAGHSVEIHVTTHMSFVGAIYEYDDGAIGIVMADDRTPDGGTGSTEQRGPWRFDPKTGRCLNLGCNLKILGFIREK